MTITWLACNLQTRHKKGPDLISQVPQISQHLNFVSLVGMPKEFNR